MKLFYTYFIYFIIYSFLGWVMEVCVSLWNKKKFINRGFLIGPYCPIYGWGVLAIILFVGSNTSDYLAVFLKAILICSLLEYFTSYFMEKIYKVRWWDYSNKMFNINGRICLETMIPFGLLALLIVYVLHPLVINLVSLNSDISLYLFGNTLLVIYIIDNVVSTSILFKIKDKIKSERKDNTEKIKKYIEKWIVDNSILYRRIKSAFPGFIIQKHRGKKK